MSSILICSGFHRSATSVTAKFLDKSGLNMGSNLMLPNSGNPSGYYEDMPAVQLHDLLLEKSGTSWQFHGEVDLANESGVFESYINSRDSVSDCWGMKDPRALLFLDRWNESLKGRGRYLFLIRHWSSCIESLNHRHSRELAFSVGPLASKQKDLIFWQQPQLAAEMWLEYNHRLQLFIESHQDKCVVLTQKALFEGAPFISDLNQRFELGLNEQVDSPINKKYLKETVTKTILKSIPSGLQKTLNDQWQRLLELTDYQSDNESPHFVDLKIHQLPKVGSALAKTLKDNFDKAQDLGKLKTLSPKVLIEQLEETPVIEVAHLINTWTVKPPPKVVKWIKDKYLIHGQINFCVGCWFLRNQMWNEAIESIKWAMVLGFNRPYVFHQLGVCFYRLENYQIAEFFLRKACEQASNNEIHKCSLGKLLVDMGKLEEGLSILKTSAMALDAQPQIVMSYATTMSKIGRLGEALPELESLFDRTGFQKARDLVITAEFMKDPDAASKMYKKAISERISNIPAEQWAYQVETLVHSKDAQKDLFSRMLEHKASLDVNI